MINIQLLIYQILNKYYSSNFLLYISLTIIIIFISILSTGCILKSNYENAEYAIKNKKYIEALQYLEKIETSSGDYIKAEKKINFVNGLIAYDKGEYRNALINFREPSLSSDQEEISNLSNICLKRYLRLYGLENININYETISLIYSGMFIRGGELKLRIRNNMTKNMVIKQSNNFRLLIKTKNGYNISVNNPKKTEFLSDESDGDFDKKSGEITIYGECTSDFMVNFDDINENPDVKTGYFFEYNNHLVIDVYNNRILFDLEKDAWLCLNLDAIKLKDKIITEEDE